MISKTKKLRVLPSLCLILFSLLTSQAQTNLPYLSDFESDNGGWTDGGNRSDYRSNDGNSPQGNDSWRIRGNEGDDSSFYQDFNLSGYDEITITFKFRSVGFDDDDDRFEVLINDNRLERYRYDDDWDNNGAVYTRSITVSGLNECFGVSTEIRFETTQDTGDSDYLYIDDIEITGVSQNPITTSTLFFENFECENRGATSGFDENNISWYTDTSGSNPDRFEVRDGNYFESEDTDGTAIWYTGIIDIADFEDLQLSSYINFSRIENGDIIKFQYKLDGGSLQDIPNAYYNGNSYDTNYTWPLTGVTGSTLEIYVVFLSDRNNDRHRIDNVKLTGVYSPQLAPVADFTADNTSTFTGDVVTLTDASTNNPTGWVWSFSNSANVTYVNATSASSQNPQVTFSAAGDYNVTLTASNSTGPDTETKTSYISVIAPASDNPLSFSVNPSSANPYTFLDLSATANANNDNILVAYNTTNTFGAPTRDGSNNIVLNGQGTIIYEGNASAIASNTLPQLKQNTTYYFKAWSSGSGGFSRGIEANAKTEAVAAPISFTANASASTNNITFSAQANSLNDNLMLVYSAEDSFGTPEDGELYQIGDKIGNAIVLLSSKDANAINNYVDDFLQFNTDYYYRIYSVAEGIWYYSQVYREADDITIDSYVLWQNEINTDDTQDDMPYTRGQEVYQNISVSGVSLGSGLRIRNADDEITMDAISTSTTLNISDNDYLEFTLTPDPGYEINFDKFYYGSYSQGRIKNVALRSSIDGFASNIGDIVDGDGGANFILTDAAFQGIYEAITFRVYLWDADNWWDDFDFQDFGFKGTISQYAVWDGTSWSNTAGPDLGIRAVIDGDYNTGVGGNQTSFRCKSLTINAENTLTVANNTFVEVNYNISGGGNITVNTKGAFVQRNEGAFNVTGTSKVNKSTPHKSQWYYYTYWSSPVKSMDIEVAFPNINRKFFWDDTAYSWKYATNQIMEIGLGYITTGKSTGVQTVSFEGEFNTGTITVPLSYKPAYDENWSLIGNPYPSAIDLNLFLGTNAGVVDGAAYFWSQETPPVGGQFSGADYIPFNATGSVSTSPDPTRAVNGYVPTGQSFFIATKASGDVEFNNDMRMADVTSNRQFFRESGIPPKGASSVNYNKLWLNLSSENGVFSQILVGYLDGATDLDDGLTYDAIKFGQGSGAFLYSTIENSNNQFVIQTKNLNSINADEIINIGYRTAMANTYTISIAKLQGAFLNVNTIYLKDNLLNVIHNLSSSDYTFSSDIGEFNTRFEIVFNDQSTLSNEDFIMNSNHLKIVELNNDDIQFSTSNSTLIKKISIYNLIGQHLFDIKANSAVKKYNFRNQKSSVYFAKIALENDIIITKKFIKR